MYYLNVVIFDKTKTTVDAAQVPSMMSFPFVDKMDANSFEAELRSKLYSKNIEFVIKRSGKD